MIGKLTGRVDIIEDDHLILDVNGVGYIVYCTNSTLSQVDPGQHFSLLIEMIVKEDQLTLYGFRDQNDKKWFRLLQTIQGVGARMALTILSAMNADQLISAILSQDYNSFKSISGIGPKLAARIVNELQGKEGLSMLTGNGQIPIAQGTAGSVDATQKGILTDALSALSNLGFNRSDAYKVLTDIIAEDKEISLESLIRQGLGKLTRK
jgi:Holliday junction DNA helicase RuvA